MNELPVLTVGPRLTQPQRGVTAKPKPQMIQGPIRRREIERREPNDYMAWAGFQNRMTLQLCPSCARVHGSVRDVPTLNELAIGDLVRAINDVQVTFAGANLIISQRSKPNSLFAIANIGSGKTNTFSALITSASAGAAAGAAFSNAIWGLTRRVFQVRIAPRMNQDWEAAPTASAPALNAYARNVNKAYFDANKTTDDEVW